MNIVRKESKWFENNIKLSFLSGTEIGFIAAFLNLFQSVAPLADRVVPIAPSSMVYSERSKYLRLISQILGNLLGKFICLLQSGGAFGDTAMKQ